MSKYRVAVVGVLGAVGQEMLKTLEQREFPISGIKPLGTATNTGRAVGFAGESVSVEQAKRGSFKGVDIALFSAGADASLELAPIARDEGCVVIDNSAAWRMDDSVPLVIPEVNPDALKQHSGIIANPNCSTIQMLVALKPLHDLFRIKRIVVSTYQAVSGTGYKAIDELENQMRQYCSGDPITKSVYPCQILLNALPQIDVFLDNGYTKEETKMVEETHKILDPSIGVSATAVRLPVFRCHSEAVNIETERPIDLGTAARALASQRGVKLVDDFRRGEYPYPLMASDKDDVFVGRLRLDESVKHGMNLWVVADNLRKGAALNAVQIAETLIEMNII
ncbi:MAG: aspartate-semialdehyde dehydrogenase [Synergistaceae bacterium]|jgi:aspartate-semialdehyde dehydrogenase|nr:aspartate-semialdehyde dehydrogenase [Synergistaceae bacterium]